MNPVKLLQALVVTDIVLTVASVPVVLLTERYLPPALQAYLEAEGEAPLRPGEIALMILGSLLLAVLLIAWVALLRGWRSGPPLYLAACAGGILLLLIAGPTVETAIGTAADSANSVISGLILGLVYFSSLRDRYAGRVTPAVRNPVGTP